MANLQATTVDGKLTTTVTENIQTGNYTLQLVDRDVVVTMNNSSAVTVTIPTDAVVNFPVGSRVVVSRVGIGAVTIAAAGVTVNAGGTGNMAPGEVIECRKRASNNWIVIQRPFSVTGTGGTSTSTIGNITVHNYTSTGASTFVVGT